MKRPTRAKCIACDLPLSDLSVHDCPRCGSSLRVVRVERPHRSRMINVGLSLPFLLAAAWAGYAIGEFSVLLIWNCIPLILGLVSVLAGVRRPGPIAAGAVTGSALCLLLTVAFHVSLYTGVGPGAQSSSLDLFVVPIATTVISAFTATVVAVAFGLLRWMLRMPPRYRHCQFCDYDLTGNTTGICPECGAVIGG